MAPNGDFFEALKREKVNTVTGTIEPLKEDGIEMSIEVYGIGIKEGVQFSRGPRVLGILILF